MKNILPGIKDSILYTDALNRLAILYQTQQLDSCGVYAAAARNLAMRIGYQQGLDLALRNLGSYYAFRPHRYLSFHFYNDALTESNTAGDTVNALMAMMNIGIYYQYNGRHDMAQQYVDRALQMSSQANLDSIHALVLGNYYFINAADTTRLSDAQHALQTATDIATRLNDKREILYLRLFRANELLRSGDITASLKTLSAVTTAALTDSMYYLAMYASMQTAGYRAWQHAPDSLHYWEQTVNYARAGGYIGLILPVATKLYGYYRKNGNAAAAASYSRLILNIMQQQQDDMQQGEMDYIAYNFQDKIMDSLRMQHLYQQQLLQTAQVESHYWQYLFIILIAVTILLLLLLLLLGKAYRNAGRRTARLALIQDQIRTANDQLRASDDFKNKLISLIAHDFRTPLYNIIDITGFIEEKALTISDATILIGEVDERATATLAVFEEILKWMRTQLSGFVYQPGTFVLSEMITAVEQSLTVQIKEKNIRVNKNIPPEFEVLADYEMLQFIHRNFLHNAVKFSTEGGAITITATRKDGKSVVTFTDEGQGIDPTVLPGLFAYNSNAHEQQRAGKGAGLALIICKDFIDKMNGETGAFNNPERGSTFFYRLPETQ
ncbi:MAG TPA: HAMP domain-containing sensor histidine kinase [Chitinophaga sp.]|uniref:ATP-binding protein n=1 Tax=Chitinophaga sp. TaxID=1869181 RepID=UPI002CF6577E|nr:HAMP domain-containing sensor histidine kinase [Chitinophaga sp.]HVI46564.1 HAMP domain-containing sensor histidine kinase [Chitinophaga sp.]